MNLEAPTWRWPLPRTRANDPRVVGELIRTGRRNVELGYAEHVRDPVPVSAARAGAVMSALELPTGFAVSIDHEDGWTTHYAHLSKLFVDPCLPDRAKRQRVAAGQILGLAARSPTHICFEMWRWDGRRFNAIDPKPELQLFTKEVDA